jgi:fructoselysine-6-P-deglycase FrlB-like protein
VIASSALLDGIVDQPDEIMRTSASLIRQASVLAKVRRSAARIPVFTGMGAALAAATPAVTHLASSGVPTIRATASELLSFRLASLGRRQTIVIASRPGDGPEVAALARELKRDDRSSFVVAVTCRAESPLAAIADVTLVADPGYRGITEIEGFAASLFALSTLARVMAGEEPSEVLGGLEISAKRTAARVRDAVATPKTSAAEISGWADRRRLILLAGGCSRAAGEAAAGLLSGTAGVGTELYDPVDFRRSMMEGVGEDVAAVVMAAEQQTRRDDMDLAREMIDRGAKVLVMTPVSTTYLPIRAGIFISGRLNRLIAPSVLVAPLQLLAWQRHRELSEKRAKQKGGTTRSAETTGATGSTGKTGTKPRRP